MAASSSTTSSRIRTFPPPPHCTPGNGMREIRLNVVTIELTCSRRVRLTALYEEPASRHGIRVDQVNRLGVMNIGIAFKLGFARSAQDSEEIKPL